MPSAIGYEPQLDVITVTLTGGFTLDGMRNLTREVLARTREHSTRRFLVDASGVEDAMPLHEILEMIADYRIAGVNGGFRMAAINADSTRLHDSMRFYETASRNRGFNVRLFPNRGEALGWLGGGGE